MPIPEGWSYKTDDAGTRQFVGDDPVLIDSDGNEQVLDLAKLRGDLTSANHEAADRKRRIRELEEAAAAFEGIDPAKYKKYKRLADKAKSATTNDTDPEGLSAKIADLEEQIEELTTERDTLSEKVTGLSTQNTKLTVGRAFETDPHFAAKNGSGPLTKMAPEIGFQMFGDYCKPAEDGSVHVFYDREHKDPVRDPETGKPAAFTEAIGKLGERMPWWKSQLAEKGGSGSGMEDAGGGGGFKGRTIKTRSDLKSNADKVAFIKEHGHDAFRELPAS